MEMYSLEIGQKPNVNSLVSALKHEYGEAFVREMFHTLEQHYGTLPPGAIRFPNGMYLGRASHRVVVPRGKKPR